MTLIPKIAIVMPYYNEPELLKRSVNAVMMQSYINWKLFIVDDGSDEANKAERNIATHRQITIINKTNSGVSDARNEALKLIKADESFDLVAYCDSDDIWHYTHLYESIRALGSSGADMVYSTPQFKMVDGTPAVPFGIPFYDSFPGLNTLKKQNFIYISSVVYKKGCLNVGWFDRELNSLEDWDMWLRVAESGFKIHQNVLSYPTLTYTCKPAGNGSRRTEDIYQKVLKKHAISNNTDS